MRMEFADDVADDARAFLERGAGVEPQQPHGVEETAVNRFQPIARIGERAMHDGRQRIVEIPLLQRLAERDLLHVGRAGNRFVVHDKELLNAGGANNRTSESIRLYRVLTLSLHEPWLNGAAMNPLGKTCYACAGWTS